MSSLFKKYGESLLGQPIGIEESQVRQAKENQIDGTVQNNGRYRRVARRAYRQSLRDKDFGGAMQALDWLEEKHGMTLGSGIRGEGAARREGERMSGVSTDHGQRSAPAVQLGKDNLRDRIGLFGEMTDAMAVGDDEKMDSFRTRAQQLGVTDDGFKLGQDRATRELRTRNTATSLDSPDLNSRLTAYGAGAAGASPRLEYMNYRPDRDGTYASEVLTQRI